MKKLLFVVALSLIMPSVVFADLYVITRPDKSVYDISEMNDAVVPEGYTKSVIVGKDRKDINVGDISIYDFDKGNFTVNGKKAADKQKKDIDDAAKVEQTRQDRASAIAKLQGLGLTEAEINALFTK